MANITYIRIGDKVYGLHDENALTSDSNLNASKVVGTLPANTYIDTTYENKAAVEGGTDVSLVTTGDKYRWNNASGGGVNDVTVNGTSVVTNKVAQIDISGKQDLLVSGTNIKTINNQSVLGSGNLSIDIPTKVSELTNDSNFQNATEVETAINTKISSVYKAKGSVAFANLPALVAANEGFVYNITDDFTTTSDFVEGAGVQYAAGTNVVIIDIGSGVYKYDVLAGMVVSTLALAQKHESDYTTTAASETTIPIGISGFRATDVLFVDINGLDLIEGTDYTISGSNIVLTTPITTIGTAVHFVAMRMAEISTQDYAQLKGDPGTIQIVR